MSQSASLVETFGITKDPTFGCGILSWRNMIDMLWDIAGGLERIHVERKVHRNLHGGNLFIEDEKIPTDARIGGVSA